MLEKKFIDVHNHILPGVDDGACNMEDTIAMLQIAYDEGIRTIICTPHHHPRRGCESIETLQKTYQLVKQEIDKLQLDIELYLGCEIYFDDEVIDNLKQGNILTMNNTKTILLEFLPNDNYIYMHNVIKRLQMEGYQVILAHFERYACLVNHEDNVEDLYTMNVLLQINAGSILGEYGRTIERFVDRMLKEKLVDLVGSDAHNQNYRSPRMKEAYQYVSKKYGEQYANEIFYQNAFKLLTHNKE
ncbi:MAG: protein tyrosine phosphatase [Holdemanella sp.]|nr:protein tyrosine phosphatase [Holdemanella sp.]